MEGRREWRGREQGMGGGGREKRERREGERREEERKRGGEEGMDERVEGRTTQLVSPCSVLP